MHVQHALLRRLGEHRGSPRLYLDTPALAAAGFGVGAAWSIELDAKAHRLTLRVCGAEGSSPAPQPRKVSSKRRGARVVPVIDLNGADHLRGFVELGGLVRILLCAGVIFVLLPAAALQARRRADRLLAKARCGEPLLCAGIAFGAGIASKALHEGLAAAGVRSRLALANEASEVCLDIARTANTAVPVSATTVAMPMQELARDAWLLAQVPAIDILEAGIPCSGASKAGVAKRGLAKMEDHPLVGHLIGATIELIAALQPAIVLIENVVDYRSSASAAILRGWLREAGYAIAEVELDASDAALIDGVPDTIGHQICGQAVDTRPVKALGRLLGRTLLAAAGGQRAGGGDGRATAPPGSTPSGRAAHNVAIAA